MGNRFLVSIVFIVGSTLMALFVWAESSVLEARVAELEQQVKILQRQVELDKEESAKKIKDAPVVTASGKDGFAIKATDESYKLKLSGYVQADARIFANNKKDANATDTFTDRTVRLTVAGTVASDFDYYLSPEFAGSSVNLPDAYLDWRITPAFKLRGGKFKAPFAYERLQSTPASTFAEVGLAENLAPNRDSGVQIFGDLFDNRLNYAVSYSNGVVDGGTSISDTNNDKDVGARVFTQPFRNSDHLALRGLGLGGAVSYGHRKDAASLPSYKTAGQNTFFTLAGTSIDGDQLRYSPQIAYYYNSLGLYGEYIVSEFELSKSGKLQKVQNEGWEVAVSYVLTGEDASYKGVVPAHPFGQSGGWGAFELAGRYSQLDIDDRIFNPALTSNVVNSTPSEADAITLGLNWYLNRSVKLVFNYERTQFEGGAAGGSARPTEDLYLSRFQLAF